MTVLVRGPDDGTIAHPGVWVRITARYADFRDNLETDLADYKRENIKITRAEAEHDKLFGRDAIVAVRVYVDDRQFGFIFYHGLQRVLVGTKRRAHESRWVARWPDRRERTYPTMTMALDALLFDAALWTWDGWVG